MQFDIIIAHYGVGALTEYCKKCLESIRKFSSNYRIIFIDNGSPEFVYIKEELDKHNHLLIRNTENLGFVKAANQGLALSSAPYIVLLNNDTEVVDGWLENLQEPLMHGAGISGPRSSAINSWQGRTHAGIGWEMLHADAMLAFFCTMFKKEVFDTLGFLDEDFGAGFGDDDWYCFRAQHAGFKLALVRHIVIQHAHRSTFKVVYGEEKIHGMQVKNMERFKAKVQEHFNSYKQK